METTTTELKGDVTAANADCEKVISILEMIIDDEATSEEQSYFYNHLEDCASCFDAHKHQKMLKDFLKLNVKTKDVPVSLISTIKNIVQETV
jgi:anti-sigma factor (TIGR02949 family)